MAKIISTGNTFVFVALLSFLGNVDSVPLEVGSHGEERSNASAVVPYGGSNVLANATPGNSGASVFPEDDEDGNSDKEQKCGYFCFALITKCQKNCNHCQAIGPFGVCSSHFGR